VSAGATQPARGSLARSLLFTTVLFATVPLYALPVLASAVLPHRHRFAIVRHWATFMLWTLRRLCGLGYVVEGRGNLPSSPCVVLLKHQSAWETFAQTVVFPAQTWVLKRELMWVPFLGWALAALKPIPIDRSAHRSALEQIVELGGARLREGLWVMVFPEGTRVAPGQQRRYGLGGAILAKSAGVPVVPVAHDAGAFWPRRAWVKHPGTIRVRIGPPIDTSDLDAQQITDAARAWIEAQMRALADGDCGPQTSR
jgi:1-acyl-sn-glycerol-3-phosphate acyltransferase